MKLTTEQQTILDHTTNSNGLTLLDSVAGSGKTTMLVTIANNIPHNNGLYLAYNKSIAVEAGRKFPKNTHCMTTHSMAYAATVRPLKLKLGTFNYKSIKERIPYEDKCLLVDLIKEFCLSKHTSVTSFSTYYHLSPVLSTLLQQYLEKMRSAEIECTHDFYLKLFHLLLNDNEVTYDPFDFIMLDEAGDLNEVTLEIFKLLPSPKKIAVGDKHQNIYAFNHTVNCFSLLESHGKSLQMTQSFRVSEHIANSIENFCRKYLEPTMSFKGIKISDRTISSRAYITRTNSALVKKMIQLNDTGTPYGLVRKAKEIFKLPLMLCGLKYQGFITDPAYKHLQEDVNHWHEHTEIHEQFKSALSYIGSLYSDDIQLSQAIKLLAFAGKKTILETYEEARKHEKVDQNYMLATAHSCKG